MNFKLIQNILNRGERPDGDAGMKAYQEEKEKVGGLFHFAVHRDEDGWSAECMEIPAIITGGKSINPSDSEIELNIREAIHAAFHITTKEELEINNITDSEAVYSFQDLVPA